MNKLWLLPFLLLVCPGCRRETSDRQHEHPEPESTQISLWDEHTELFIEHPPFVAGVPTRLVTHVTHLRQWHPRTEGEIVVILSKESRPPIEIRDQKPARDGIYIPTLTFPEAGSWDIEIRVPMEDATSSQVIQGVAVHAEHEVLDMSPETGESGSSEEISFLKEQQWRIPFASEPVLERPFRESLGANGTIEPRAGGSVAIHAPMDGRVLAPESSVPHLGALVEKGQRLGTIVPRLDRASDQASLTLAVQKAELNHAFAQKELERIEGLFRNEAVPRNRLRLAELEVETTRADLRAAKNRLQQYAAVMRKAEDPSQGQVDLFSPISGTIVEAEMVPGALLSEGDRLFTIIDMNRVWLKVQIPETEIGRVSKAQGAWFQAEGLEQIYEVGGREGGRLIAVGGKVDPERRTVPLIFELPNPGSALKIGMFVRAFVLTGQRVTGPSIPFSAVVEESGQTIAYVQTGGESFERRLLQLGIRDGDRVQVRSGVVAGERVVTKGAYRIRLAAASTTIPAHGHEH